MYRMSFSNNECCNSIPLTLSCLRHNLLLQIAKQFTYDNVMVTAGMIVTYTISFDHTKKFN